MSTHTAQDVADEFRCSKQTVTKVATKHRIGFNLKGPAGYRFTDADVAALREALRPAPAKPTRTRRIA